MKGYTRKLSIYNVTIADCTRNNKEHDFSIKEESHELYIVLQNLADFFFLRHSLHIYTSTT